jgi:SAM-dependent methyltransferase
MPGETEKAHERRTRQGWFEKYAPVYRSGIDIGCQYDPLNQSFRRWDRIFGDGDATRMEGIPDGIFHTVYASHILEHLPDYKSALKNWWRILRSGGHLIILVPHRDLYEKKLQPPSNWNMEHCWFWLPDADDPPQCLNFKLELTDTLPDAELVSFEILAEGYIELPANQHSVGEYSIEAILKKP